MNKYRQIANFVLFQAGWFACVLGAAHGFVWASAIAIAAIAAIHFRWVSTDRLRDLRLVILAPLIGGAGDSLVAMTGWLRFEAAWPIPWLEPIWMLLLWVNFPMTLNASLAWLNRRYVLGAVLGATGGPLAYWTGAQLGALEIVGPFWPAMLLIGVAWAILLPAILVINVSRLPAAIDRNAKTPIFPGAPTKTS